MTHKEIDALIKKAAAQLVLDAAYSTTEWHRKNTFHPYEPTFAGRSGKMISILSDEKMKFINQIEYIYDTCTEDWIEMRERTKKEYNSKAPTT